MFPTDTDFDAKVILETEMSPVLDGLPFNMLFIGNWSGNRDKSLNINRLNLNPVEVDRDNFDEVMRKLHIKLDLSFQDSGETSLTLEFNEFEDFHPDNIFQQVSIFSNFRDIRRKLTNANTYNEAAKEVLSWIKNANSDSENSVPQDNVFSENSVGVDSLLDQILGQTSQNSSASQKLNTPKSELSTLIEKLVKPHLIQVDAVEQSNLLLIIDELTSDLMRKILHHPQFQALESAWRGMYLLVRKVETAHDLKIYLLDIDKSELAGNLKSAPDFTDTDVCNLLIDEEKSWALVGGNYSFNLNVDDAAVLIRLAKIGSQSNVPFISYIQPDMFDINDFDAVSVSDKLHFNEDSSEGKLWNALRSVPEATHLGLAIPRYLARIPYGEKTDPIETFYFEEFTENIQHGNYLWTNPVFICGLLFARSFRSSGWAFSSNMVQDFDGLPIHFYQEGTEMKSKSCAEIVMTQSNAETIIEQGLMPLIAYRDTDRLRVGRFQSIAFSESMLSGRWK